MAGDGETTGGQSLQTITSPGSVRLYSPVEDAIPLLDTARFEHMQRIATIMATSSLIPEALRCEVKGEGDQRKTEPLDPRTVVSNCFLVVNQAVRWGMDPFGVAQCCSIVRGKLMYEGKLVAAVIEARLATRLSYEFGAYDPKRHIFVKGAEPEGPMLAVQVSATLPGESQPRTIEGYVEGWTTGAKGPWANPAAWRRQLRYRGAREWARAHAPGIMLGVITDDEIDDLVDRRAELERSKPAITAGFPDDPKLAAPEPKNEEASPPPKEAEKPKPDPKPKPPAAKKEEAPKEAPKPASTPEVPKDERTVAPAGDQYLIRGEGYEDGGRRPLYRDGIKFSTVTEAGAEKYQEYDDHPAAEEEAAPEGESSPNTSSGSPDDDRFPGDPPAAQSQSAGEVFGKCHEDITAATSWLGIKQCMRTLAKTEAWAETEDEGKRMLRMIAWERYADLRDEGKDTTDPAIDISLFRLWLEFGAASQEQIDGMWRVFYRKEGYANASEPDKKAIAEFKDQRRTALPEKA